MARRMPRRLYIQRDQQLIARDGDVCPLCVFEAGGQDTGPITDPTIDHIDNRKSNHSLRNLIRMCRGHNTAEENRRRAGLSRFLTVDNVDDLRRTAETACKTRTLNALQKRPPKSQPQPQGTGEGGREGGMVDRRGWAPVEESASMVMDRRWRWYAFRIVRDEGFITRNDAIHGGTEHVKRYVGRASQKTIERYFQSAESREGWLMERTRDGVPVWVFRPHVDVKDLERELWNKIEEIGGAE